MEITLEERKKWLKEHDSEIKAHCLLSIKDLLGNIESEEKIQEMATNSYKRISKQTLESENTCHKECIGKLSLYNYLAKIRKNKRESLMCLIIKNGKVIGEIVEEGELSICDKDEKTSDKAFEKAKELKADIYFVHNHPAELQAMPSGGIINLSGKNIETSDFRNWHTTLPNKAKKYGVSIIDYAVVTENDYFSLEQSGWKDVSQDKLYEMFELKNRK